MNTVEVKDRAEWRAWLQANYDLKAEVWLIYYKKGTGKPGVDYEASIEEALCFGWVDSLIKKLDESCHARKFTPRRVESRWSISNIRRVEKMIEAGLMTEHGLALVAAARQSGQWDAPTGKPILSFDMPAEFAEALAKNPQAEETFNSLAPTYRKQYLGWIEIAKRPETKARRIEESIRLLADGKKLGLR